jgi:lipopolysaccharide/colanic/teichoic acid biosynthesis glycosyltransferase
MYLKIKRLIDLIISTILLLILFPLNIIIGIILIAIGIGNPIYKQTRTGKDGKDFTIYKFTTMKEKNVIPKFCMFLRKTGLDETLQLINIIKGEMSLIGPRPWIIDYKKHFTKKQKRRLEVLPGLTGLAQTRNTKNVLEKIEYDIYYVDNISFKMDLYVFFSSFTWIIFGKKNEYSTSDIQGELELLKKNKRGKK